METRIQHRAVCPACFGLWAVKGSTIVDHGFEVPHWGEGGFRSGTCAGARHSHFGTEAGRAYAAELADSIERQAEKAEAAAAAYARGEGEIFEMRRAGGQRLPFKVENPQPWQFAEKAREAAYHAELARREVKARRERIAAWQPVEPVDVVVEKKGPTVHLLANYWNRDAHKACASSFMGAYRGQSHLTTDESRVTCTRCLAQIAKRDAKAAK